MADLPIIFSAPMVKALLDGRKTQTRRVLKPQPFAAVAGFERVFKEPPFFEARDASGKPIERAFPYPKGFVSPYPRLAYAPGDRLWVKEDFCFDAQMDGLKPSQVSRYEPRGYPANNWIIEPACMMIRAGRVRRARFMPRWASRLTLTVTEVRIQRLQDISAYDVEAEGACELAVLPPCQEDDDEARGIFRDLWNSLHGPGAWDRNEWVCALTFTVQRGNIDQLGATA
jgi:hypothetical protein